MKSNKKVGFDALINVGCFEKRRSKYLKLIKIDNFSNLCPESDFQFMDSTSNNFGGTAKMLAWSVHIFTASGLLSGFMAILAIQAHDWRMAMFWLVICQVIDVIDGTFARLFRVKD